MSRVECSGRAYEHTREVDHERTRGKRTHARAAERAPHARTTWAHHMGARTHHRGERTHHRGERTRHTRTRAPQGTRARAHHRGTRAHHRGTRAHHRAHVGAVTRASETGGHGSRGARDTLVDIHTRTHTHTDHTHTHTHVQRSFNTSDVVHEYVRDRKIGRTFESLKDRKTLPKQRV